MDFSIREHEFGGNEDRTWLLTRKGFDTCRTVTLDVSTFVAAHLTDKGAIPSGTVLAKNTSTGLYEPYVQGTGANGNDTARGFLFNTTKVGGPEGSSETDLATAANVVVPMLWEGVIDESELPAFTGTTLGELDANGKADLTHCVFE